MWNMNVIGDYTVNSENRFKTQESLLKTGAFFKFICGAGNEDTDEVYKLSLVYTLAGAKGIDISARAAIVKSTVDAINDAEKLLGKFHLDNYVYVIH